MHHSLWVTPLDPVYDTMIAQLSERSKTPHFPAHVTALEGFDGDERYTQLASGPFEVVFVRVGIHGESVVLEADDSEPLAALSTSARELFGGDAPPIHLSLVYFSENIEEVRSAIEEALDLPLTIRFSRLELWDTKGDLTRENVREWTMISRKAL